MSLQWTFVASFLYAEIFLCALLLLPFISPQRWQKIFRSRMLNAFRSYANIYFNVFIVILLILFFDAIRDVRRYSMPAEEVDLQVNPAAEVQLHMKLFRSQRNFYIAGFALFLFFVLRRLVTLISTEATLMAESEAAKKQAESATAAAKKFMEEIDNKANEKGEKSDETAQELEKSKQECGKLREDKSHAVNDLEAIKKQAESTNKEYDRLLDENAKLQDLVKKLKGEEALKKED